jgi:hypothetical protein
VPRKLPPFVECWRDRHGRIRIYFRKGKGRRIALPAAVGSDDFNAAYQAALAGQVDANRGGRQPDQPGTIGALISSYLRSAAYLGLRETTKAGYASRIEALRTRHGHRTLAGLTRERIITGILQPYAGRPGAALSILKRSVAVGIARSAGQGRETPLGHHWDPHDAKDTILEARNPVGTATVEHPQEALFRENRTRLVAGLPADQDLWHMGCTGYS